jgi:hypothetical protein
MMSPIPMPVEVFYSYADADEDLRHELEKHLSVLRYEGLIITWQKRQITAGTDWTQALNEHLETASLILLLISPDFLASAYCYGVEMQRALARHRAGSAWVVPLLLRPVDWQGAPFAHLQSLPYTGRPVTIWPNQDEAFAEIARGIRRLIEGAEPFTESRPQSARFGASFPAIWNVFRRHNPFFTGRDQVLEQLFAGFRSEEKVGIVPPQALTGLGGMGKTQTAAEYAYRFRGQYQAVLWMRAETHENLVANFRTIAGLLKRPQEHLRDEASLLQTMHEWFRTNAGWLLIFDNADDLALVHPFVPRVARGHILLTTRAGATVEQAQPLVLGPLDPDDGALCILRRSGLLTWDKHLQDAPHARVDAARQLSLLMNGLPLALEQAGAYIDDTACGVKRYLHLYEQYRLEIQQLRHGVIPDYPESVASTWRVSRRMVEQDSPAAAELLRLCAFFAPEAIPDELLTRGASALGPVLGPIAEHPVELDRSIKLLHKYSLLDREADHETELTRLSVHRVLQEILLDEMDVPTRQIWTERAVCALMLAMPTMPWSQLQAHARSCLQFVEQWQLHFPEAERLKRCVEEAERREAR